MSEQTETGAYSIRAFVTKFSISRSQTYKEIQSGRLIAKKLHSKTLIPAAAARQWLDSLPTKEKSSAA